MTSLDYHDKADIIQEYVRKHPHVLGLAFHAGHLIYYRALCPDLIDERGYPATDGGYIGIALDPNDYIDFSAFKNVYFVLRDTVMFPRRKQLFQQIESISREVIVDDSERLSDILGW